MLHTELGVILKLTRNTNDGVADIFVTSIFQHLSIKYLHRVENWISMDSKKKKKKDK